MYFVMATDNTDTETFFFLEEAQALAAFNESCESARSFHFVTFVYLAAVEMSGTPAKFDLFEEDRLCWGLLKLERVKSARCTAIDGKHGLKSAISLDDWLEDVENIIKNEIQDDVDCAESYYGEKIEDLLDADENTESYERD